MSAVQTHVELKGAYTRLERATSELKVLEKERHDIDQKITGARAKIARIEGEIEQLKKAPEVIVSEHALLRYVERVMKIDIGEIKKKILTADVVQAITHFHGGSIPHPDGFTCRVRENVVTTIITDDEGEP